MIGKEGSTYRSESARTDQDPAVTPQRIAQRPRQRIRQGWLGEMFQGRPPVPPNDGIHLSGRLQES